MQPETVDPTTSAAPATPAEATATTPETATGQTRSVQTPATNEVPVDPAATEAAERINQTTPTTVPAVPAGWEDEVKVAPLTKPQQGESPSLEKVQANANAITAAGDAAAQQFAGSVQQNEMTGESPISPPPVVEKPADAPATTPELITLPPPPSVPPAAT